MVRWAGPLRPATTDDIVETRQCKRIRQINVSLANFEETLLAKWNIKETLVAKRKLVAISDSVALPKDQWRSQSASLDGDCEVAAAADL